VTPGQEGSERFVRNFKAGELVFKQGDLGEHMFIIQAGKIEIFVNTPKGEKSLAVLGAGDFFGEMAIIDKGSRSASARAIGEARAITLDEKTFDLHVQSNPAIVHKILKNMSTRLRDANNQIQNLMIKDINRRVANRILVVCHQHGQKGADGIKIDFPWGENDLAKDVGLGDDAGKVHEVLEKMKQGRIVDVRDGQIVILSVENLEKFIQFLQMKEELGF